MARATFRIWRGDATGGAFQDYVTETSEGMVVLDAVHHIQAESASDLACRWNCKAGKCGSCSAEINGKPRLMCMTRMDTVPQDQPIPTIRQDLLELFEVSELKKYFTDEELAGLGATESVEELAGLKTTPESEALDTAVAAAVIEAEIEESAAPEAEIPGQQSTEKPESETAAEEK